MTSSFVTLFNLACTVTPCCCLDRFLLLPLILNVILLLLWSLSLCLLSSNMSGTLQHRCNSINWGTDAGIMVCRLYKALYSFVVVGFVAQAIAVVFDINARRHQRDRGGYGAMRNSTMLANVKLNQPEIVVSSTNTLGNTPQRMRKDPDIIYPQPNGQDDQLYEDQILSALEQNHAGKAREFSNSVFTQSQR
jgi:hypothetical protein